MLSVHQGWAFVPFPRTGGVPNALGNKTYTKVDVKNNRQVLVAIHAGVGGTGSSTAGPGSEDLRNFRSAPGFDTLSKVRQVLAEHDAAGIGAFG